MHCEAEALPPYLKMREHATGSSSRGT
jgi:hypothetical protein